MCISNNRTNGAICQAFCNTNCNLRRAADDLEDFSKKMNATLDKNYIDLNGVSVKIFRILSCQEDEHKFNRKEKPQIASMRNGDDCICNHRRCDSKRQFLGCQISALKEKNEGILKADKLTHPSRPTAFGRDTIMPSSNDRAKSSMQNRLDHRNQIIKSWHRTD